MNIERQTLENLSLAMKVEEELSKNIRNLDRASINNSLIIIEGHKIALCLYDNKDAFIDITKAGEGLHRQEHQLRNMNLDELKIIIISKIKQAIEEHKDNLLKEAKKQFKKELLGED